MGSKAGKRMKGMNLKGSLLGQPMNEREEVNCFQDRTCKSLMVTF